MRGGDQQPWLHLATAATDEEARMLSGRRMEAGPGALGVEQRGSGVVAGETRRRCSGRSSGSAVGRRHSRRSEMVAMLENGAAGWRRNGGRAQDGAGRRRSPRTGTTATLGMDQRGDGVLGWAPDAMEWGKKKKR
jgi:hypothetical protein